MTSEELATIRERFPEGQEMPHVWESPAYHRVRREPNPQQIRGIRDIAGLLQDLSQRQASRVHDEAPG